MWFLYTKQPTNEQFFRTLFCLFLNLCKLWVSMTQLVITWRTTSRSFLISPLHHVMAFTSCTGNYYNLSLSYPILIASNCIDATVFLHSCLSCLTEKSLSYYGWRFEKHDLVEGTSAHARGDGTRCSLRSLSNTNHCVILWFYSAYEVRFLVLLSLLELRSLSILSQVTEWLRLEDISGDYLVQPSCLQQGQLQQISQEKNPVGFWRSPKLDTWQLLWAAWSAVPQPDSKAPFFLHFNGISCISI